MNKNMQIGHEFLSSKVSGRTCEVTGISGSIVSYRFLDMRGTPANKSKHVDDFVKWYHVPDEVYDETAYTLLRVRSDLVTKEMMMLAESLVQDNGDKLQVTKHRDFGSVTPSEALSRLLPNKLGPKTIVEVSGAKVSEQVQKEITGFFGQDVHKTMVIANLPKNCDLKIHKLDSSDMSPIVTSGIKHPWSFKSWVKSWIG